MFANKTIFTILLTLFLKTTPLIAYADPRFTLHEWVGLLEDTLESALKLRPKVKKFITQFEPTELYAGLGSKFYVGGALMKAIQQNKLHLAAILVEFQPDYDVRGRSEDGNELNIFHFCAQYLPNTTQSVAFIKHIIAESDSQVMLSLLNDSRRWQRSEIILPLQLAEKHKKDKIAKCFKDILENLNRRNT